MKWFNGAKGYGFIRRDNSEDLFVHHSAIQADGDPTLEQGAKVEFDVVKGPKGPRAVSVSCP